MLYGYVAAATIIFSSMSTTLHSHVRLHRHLQVHHRLLRFPCLRSEQKQTGCCKRYGPRLGKGVKLTTTIILVVACGYVASQLFSAGEQLRDGAGQIREQLQGVKDDVGLVKDMFTMCKQFVQMCVPCLPKSEQE